MEKKNIDWSTLGFGYHQTEKRYVSNYKNGAWNDGVLTDDANITLNECAGVFQYAQTCFEGLKAYTTEDGRTVVFRPDLNEERMHNSCERLELPIPLTTYVARHSYATILKRAGVSTSIISESLGHSSEKITQVYLDSFDNEQVDEAMKNLL